MTDGTITRTADGVRFRYERRLRQPIETVWQGITDPEQIERWTGSRPRIDLREGGEYLTYHGGGQHTVVDRIIQVHPPRLLIHTFWQQVNPDATVSWELRPEGTGTLLVLTHVLTEQDLIQASTSVAAKDDLFTILSRNGAGWHRLLDLLRAHLDGTTTPEADAAVQQQYGSQVRELIATFARPGQ